MTPQGPFERPVDAAEYAAVLADRTEASSDPGRELCALAVSTLHMSGGGLLVGRGSTLECVAVADERSELVEAIEHAVGEGPCISAFNSATHQATRDPAFTAAQWPAFEREADRAGIVAAYGFPLMARETCFGSMNLYGDVPGPLTDGQLADALTVVRVSGDLVLEWQAAAPPGEIAWQLARFFDDRVAVHQAVGRISVQAGISIADARALLRAYAFSHDRSVFDVATAVAAGSLRLG